MGLPPCREGHAAARLARSLRHGVHWAGELQSPPAPWSPAGGARRGEEEALTAHPPHQVPPARAHPASAEKSPIQPLVACRPLSPAAAPERRCRACRAAWSGKERQPGGCGVPAVTRKGRPTWRGGVFRLLPLLPRVALRRDAGQQVPAASPQGVRTPQGAHGTCTHPSKPRDPAACCPPPDPPAALPLGSLDWVAWSGTVQRPGGRHGAPLSPARAAPPQLGEGFPPSREPRNTQPARRLALSP